MIRDNQFSVVIIDNQFSVVIIDNQFSGNSGPISGHRAQILVENTFHGQNNLCISWSRSRNEFANRIIPRAVGINPHRQISQSNWYTQENSITTLGTELFLNLVFTVLTLLLVASTDVVRNPCFTGKFNRRHHLWQLRLFHSFCNLS